MISPVLRRQVLQASTRARCFSTTPLVAASQVNRLGVVGAGQMVSEFGL